MAERARKLRVLWATDGSEAARGAVPILKQAVLPAAERLVVMTVAPHSFLSGARPDPAFLTKITPAARRKALTESEQTAQREATLLDPSVPVEAIARWGNPIEEILRAARTTPADMIVMGAKGHSNLGLLLLGSVSQGVVQHATKPVLIARPGGGEIKSVLIGYEGSAPAKRAADFVQRLALPKSVSFRLTHVIEPFAVPSGTPISYRKRAIEEAHKINERQHRAAERALSTLAATLSKQGRNVETEVLFGPAGSALEESAREHGVDLIVVGSRKPSPARHYLLGSTAEKLVRHSPTSVLIVR
jgi:nucleotide-binding universal stress UspA family protein